MHPYVLWSPLTLMFALLRSLLPSIVDEQQRLNYKREFDRDHQEYKRLQAELDNVNLNLAELSRDLDRYPADTSQFLVNNSNIPIISNIYTMGWASTLL